MLRDKPTAFSKMRVMSTITQSPVWKSLLSHKTEIAKTHLRDLFAKDPGRFTKFSLKFQDILLDFSKNRITEETLKLLLALTGQANLKDWISKMFSGEKINLTEERAVLHIALRNRSNTPIKVDGQDVMPDVKRVLAQMKHFAPSVRGGQWKGIPGKTINDIVNIGIGGSDLGPVMVTEAFKPYGDESKLRVHFVSNVDGTHIAETLKKPRSEDTLFLIASKTFTTQETMTNAGTARDWFLEKPMTSPPSPNILPRCPPIRKR